MIRHRQQPPSAPAQSQTQWSPVAAIVKGLTERAIQPKHTDASVVAISHRDAVAAAQKLNPQRTIKTSIADAVRAKATTEHAVGPRQH